MTFNHETAETDERTPAAMVVEEIRVVKPLVALLTELGRLRDCESRQLFKPTLGHEVRSLAGPLA
jgi:hypothetical protein